MCEFDIEQNASGQHQSNTCLPSSFWWGCWQWADERFCDIRGWSYVRRWLQANQSDGWLSWLWTVLSTLSPRLASRCPSPCVCLVNTHYGWYRCNFPFPSSPLHCRLPSTISSEPSKYKIKDGKTPSSPRWMKSPLAISEGMYPCQPWTMYLVFLLLFPKECRALAMFAVGGISSYVEIYLSLLIVLDTFFSVGPPNLQSVCLLYNCGNFRYSEGVWWFACFLSYGSCTFFIFFWNVDSFSFWFTVHVKRAQCLK